MPGLAALMIPIQSDESSTNFHSRYCCHLPRPSLAHFHSRCSHPPLTQPRALVHSHHLQSCRLPPLSVAIPATACPFPPEGGCPPRGGKSPQRGAASENRAHRPALRGPALRRPSHCGGRRLGRPAVTVLAGPPCPLHVPLYPLHAPRIRPCRTPRLAAQCARACRRPRVRPNRLGPSWARPTQRK